MFRTVLFFGQPTRAYTIPESDPEMIKVFAPGPRPSEKHVLAAVADDSPFRWLLLAE